MEGDCCKSFAFVFNFNIFLCLKSLVQALIVTTALHNTAGELVNDFNLTVFNNIVDISCHNAVSLDSLVDMVEKCCVFNIHKVFNAEEFLCLFDTALKECGCFSLLVNYKVAVVLLLGIFFIIGLCNLNHFERFCKIVCAAIKVCRLLALTADDKRSTRLINKD